MATTKSGEIVQAWVPVELADRLRRQAEVERRSVSSTIKNAIQDQLAKGEGRRDE